MPRKKTPKGTAEIYQLHTSLRDIEPAIWRRVMVSSHADLEELHTVIQGLFDWEDCHLHCFETQIGQFTSSMFDEFLAENPEMHSSSDVLLQEVLPRVNSKIVYEYDFGDGWEHVIKLEKKLSPEPGAKYPVVIAGARHAPLEDCGGPFGYMDLAEIMKNGPKDEDERGMLEWSGEFDPEEFDLARCNKRLAGYCKPRVLERLPPKKKSPGKPKKEE